MKIICDSCGTKYSISDDKVRGKVFKIRCKKCSHIIVVRGGETAGPRRPRRRPRAVEGGWHIVVDGEQVGPIPEADVRARIERGEINADTYIWKEGFADWVKLSAVPEFADLVPPTSGSRQHRRGVHGRRPAPQPTNGTGDQRAPRARARTVRCSVTAAAADVFAAPAAAAPRRRRRPVRLGGVHRPPSESRWPPRRRRRRRRWPATTAAASRT